MKISKIEVKFNKKILIKDKISKKLIFFLKLTKQFI